MTESPEISSDCSSLVHHFVCVPEELLGLLAQPAETLLLFEKAVIADKRCFAVKDSPLVESTLCKRTLTAY